MIKVGDVIGGRLRVDRMLGVGGFGVVAAATHLELRHEVAVKLLKPEFTDDAEIVDRFLREARAVAGLRTEHVCRVFDIGRTDAGAPYIVMELLQGADLSAILRRGAIPIPTAVDHTLHALAALAEAHPRGIVHRDLKPPNLFVTRRADNTTLVKVLDFGIAKAVDELRLTHSGVMLGSPQYMSPEQVTTPRDVDARTDIWSIGVTLYHMIARRLPFPSAQIAELAVLITSHPPAPLDDVDPALRAVIWRCLEKDRAARYQDVRELAAALAPFGTAGTRAPSAGTPAGTALPPGTVAASPPAPHAVAGAAPVAQHVSTLASIASAATPHAGAAGAQHVSTLASIASAATPHAGAPGAMAAGAPGAAGAMMPAGAPGAMPAGVAGAMSAGAGAMPAGAPGAMPAGVAGAMPAGAGAMPAGAAGAMPAGAAGAMPAGVAGAMPAGAPGAMPVGVAGAMPAGAGATRSRALLFGVLAVAVVGIGGVVGYLALASSKPSASPTSTAGIASGSGTSSSTGAGAGTTTAGAGSTAGTASSSTGAGAGTTTAGAGSTTGTASSSAGPSAGAGTGSGAGTSAGATTASNAGAGGSTGKPPRTPRAGGEAASGGAPSPLQRQLYELIGRASGTPKSRSDYGSLVMSIVQLACAIGELDIARQYFPELRGEERKRAITECGKYNVTFPE